MATIETTRGMIEESDLRKEEKEEKIACGASIETTYFLGDEIVRQDVLIRVDRGVISEAFSSPVVADADMSVNEFISKIYSDMTQEFAIRIGDRIIAQYPYLKGMKFAFDLPGFKVEIDPTEEGK